ncbi:MAG: trimethylamine methyltransferase family protein, partial [Caldilinea sp.]
MGRKWRNGRRAGWLLRADRQCQRRSSARRVLRARGTDHLCGNPYKTVMRPTLSIADPALLDRIIDEARHILATTGMEIRGASMHRLLLDAGLPAAADGRILFPGEVVDRALKSAPASFTLFDRDGNPHAEIGGDNVNFTPGSSGLKVQDHRTGHTRQATTADFVEYVRVCD